MGAFDYRQAQEIRDCFPRYVRAFVRYHESYRENNLASANVFQDTTTDLRLGMAGRGFKVGRYVGRVALALTAHQ